MVRYLVASISAGWIAILELCQVAILSGVAYILVRGGWVTVTNRLEIGKPNDDETDSDTDSDLE